MGVFHMTVGSTQYAISDREVPSRGQLPWGDQTCDAFIAILEPELLTDRFAQELSLGLVGLQTDWIEAMGGKSEFLHDCIDGASVQVGRQMRVGEGNPMTAWHDEFSDIESMINYIRIGGQGASDFKLILLIGSERSQSVFRNRLRQVLFESAHGPSEDTMPNGRTQ